MASGFFGSALTAGLGAGLGRRLGSSLLGAQASATRSGVGLRSRLLGLRLLGLRLDGRLGSRLGRRLGSCLLGGRLGNALGRRLGSRLGSSPPEGRLLLGLHGCRPDGGGFAGGPAEPALSAGFLGFGAAAFVRLGRGGVCGGLFVRGHGSHRVGDGIVPRGDGPPRAHPSPTDPAPVRLEKAIEVVAQLLGPGPPHPTHLIEVAHRGAQQALQVAEAGHQRRLHRLREAGHPIQRPVAPGANPGVERTEIEERGDPRRIAEVLGAQALQQVEGLARLGGKARA